MKKLALVLGTLLLAATASAKEVVAAPVVVEEVTVEEAVVVPTPEFKPTGFFRLEQKYFGKGEHDDVTGNYFRTELTGAVKMTENDALQLRVRSYDDLNGTGSDQASKSENTETRYRWTHSFGTLGESKVKFATRLEMRQREDYDRYEAQTRFTFTDYIPQSDVFQTTDFTLAPKVRYVSLSDDGSTSSDDQSTGAGMNFYHYAVMPYGFEWDLTVYYLYSDTDAGYTNTSEYPSGSKISNTGADAGEDTTSGNNIDVEAYIYWTQPGYVWQSTDAKQNIHLYAEGGLDALTYRDGSGDTNNNSMYVMPEVVFDTKLNSSTLLSFAVGAEYRNWNDDNMDSIKNFTWQEYARLAIKTTF